MCVWGRRAFGGSRLTGAIACVALERPTVILLTVGITKSGAFAMKCAA